MDGQSAVWIAGTSAGPGCARMGGVRALGKGRQIVFGTGDNAHLDAAPIQFGLAESGRVVTRDDLGQHEVNLPAALAAEVDLVVIPGQRDTGIAQWQTAEITGIRNARHDQKRSRTPLIFAGGKGALSSGPGCRCKGLHRKPAT
jgi:hypothetical protein